jgi:hypothetical protein
VSDHPRMTTANRAGSRGQERHANHVRAMLNELRVMNVEALLAEISAGDTKAGEQGS